MTDSNKEFWEDGKDYNEYVCHELKDRRKDLWKNQILKHMPSDNNAKILDIGCGPGFFSCILSECGYDVIGIDRSDDMLNFAKKNADSMKVSPEFYNMDASDIDFCDNTFDIIISRNVTWTFKTPKETYSHLFKKLKKGGMLIIYDANWHIPFYQSEAMDKVRENEKWYMEKFNQEFKVYDDDKSIFENLPLSNIVRPEWDIDVLYKIGFESIQKDENISKNVYCDWERRLYSATPMFEIIARK